MEMVSQPEIRTPNEARAYLQKLRAILRTLILLPWAIPPVVNGLMWQWIYDSKIGALNGLLVRKDGKEVVLKDAQNVEVRVSADNVELLQPARDSLMPTGQLADFTAQQAADLLEYLATRR